MTDKEINKHNLAMKIVEILINSNLSINEQIKVIENVRQKLIFCKTTGQKMQQFKLKL